MRLHDGVCFHGLRFLTDFAVDTRYPGDNATKWQAKAAVRWAKRVRTAGSDDIERS